MKEKAPYSDFQLWTDKVQDSILADESTTKDDLFAYTCVIDGLYGDVLLVLKDMFTNGVASEVAAVEIMKYLKE